ncbi:hypothetical protein AAG906_020941 [Vitis piasezkii]
MPKFIMYDGTSNPFDHIMHLSKHQPGHTIFESLAKKSPITMDDLFKRANKYYMLEDDVRAASQQAVFTNHSTNNDKAESSKPLNQSRQVDFLQMSTYCANRPLAIALENLRRLLSRFNRVITTSLGDVMLLLQADPVIMSVQFSMVDDLSPYNAIMGRAWLHKMKTFLLRTIKW